MKTCKICNQTKKLTEFSQKRSNRDGYSGECKACKNAKDAVKRNEKKLEKQFEII